MLSFVGEIRLYSSNEVISEAIQTISEMTVSSIALYNIKNTLDNIKYLQFNNYLIYFELTLRRE